MRRGSRLAFHIDGLTDEQNSDVEQLLREMLSDYADTLQGGNPSDTHAEPPPPVEEQAANPPPPATVEPPTMDELPGPNSEDMTTEPTLEDVDATKDALPNSESEPVHNTPNTTEPHPSLDDPPKDEEKGGTKAAEEIVSYIDNDELDDWFNTEDAGIWDEGAYYAKIITGANNTGKGFKDKDMMADLGGKSDTGSGATMKPPRSDVKKNFNPADLPKAEQGDFADIENNPDMKLSRQARLVARVANSIIAEGKPDQLNGLRKSQASNLLNKTISPMTKGLFKDQYWAPVQDIFKKLGEMGVNFSIYKTEYAKNEDGNPISKTWQLVVEFFDNKGKPQKIYGTVVASGAGSIKEPLDKYDIVAYFN